ncbi:helix-turn-helix domain-containing protein [Neobacillus mesonae]|uniref:helix-turn-helix domain-containing protein n=1 Tax=Neobacillus mesonae TaxID=1193713 RepID=UPI002E20201E|nr:helix-turn-helix domain-containing protein [Neobacillus mesonae]
MIVGEIIKFYREKSGMTQSQLGEGICTPTHVSKIEHGKTAYSPEIITLFSERLQIDIQKEVETFQEIEKKLHSWHNAIIMQRIQLVEEYKQELEAIPYIDSSKYGYFFRLLKARYFLLHDDGKRAFTIVQQIQKDCQQLSLFERNLLCHVKGIYYLFYDKGNDNQRKAIHVLKEINPDDYGIKEYYYHLGVAFHCIDSKVMAYYYAKNALDHFKKTNNFLKALNAESLLLIQIGKDRNNDFLELEERYNSLIRDSEILGAPDKKGMMLNNLGHEYFRRGDYENSLKCLAKALKIANRSTFTYTKRLYNYVDTAMKGKLLRKTILLKKAREGLSSAKQLDSTLYQILFKIHIYDLQDQKEQYYHYLEQTAFPYLKTSKHVIYLNRYGKELYNYYIEIGQTTQALQIACFFMDNIE